MPRACPRGEGDRPVAVSSVASGAGAAQEVGVTGRQWGLVKKSLVEEMMCGQILGRHKDVLWDRQAGGVRL